MNKPLNHQHKRDREFIQRAVNSNRFDVKFAELCIERAKSSHNIADVKMDIENYHHSKRGIVFAHRNYTSGLCHQYENPLVINLTSRFPIDADRIKNKYEQLIRYLSRIILKNAYRRHGKTIGNIGYVEIKEHTHMHCVLNRPVFIDENIFKRLIRDYWYKHTGTLNIDDTIKEQGKEYAVANYISKLNDKQAFHNFQEAFIQV